jgi:predicted HTH domain antitoxin
VTTQMNERYDLVEWELRQLVATGIFPDEQAVLRGALRSLFQCQPGMKVKMVIGAYEGGEISLGKAACLLGVSQEEMKDILRDARTPIHLGPESIEELHQDVRNA